MSAPDTNVERQKRRHIVPLIGIGIAAVFGVVLIVYWIFEEVAASDPVTQDEVIEAPATAIPPEVTAPAPSAEPGTQPTPLAPAPAPQDDGAQGSP